MSLGEAIAGELAALDPIGIELFDVHSHTGVDVDGTTRSCEEHVEALTGLGGRSVIFPLCVRGGYEAENLRVVEECAAHPERLVPFARLDPRVSSAVDARSALDAGARGFKLHPRAEDFRLEHPGVEAIAAVAAEARAPVLIHAGGGVGSLGTPIIELAERHRDCPLILAHAAVSDLAWLGPLAAEHPNVFFDTSWWNSSDLLALFALVPPGQILFGSDEPYMDLPLVLAISLRCARFAGLSDDTLRLVFGAQTARLLAGGPAVEAGPPPGPPGIRLSPLEARLATLLAGAGGCMLGGGDPSRIVELARVATIAPPAEEGTGLVTRLVEEAAAGGPEAPWALAMASTILVSPGVESPVPAH